MTPHHHQAKEMAERDKITPWEWVRLGAAAVLFLIVLKAILC